jgi:hypothetical protein
MCHRFFSLKNIKYLDYYCFAMSMKRFVVILGVVLAIALAGNAHAFASWGPVIQANQTISNIVSYGAGIVFSAYGGPSLPIYPNSTIPLIISLPGSAYIGPFANGYYYSAINVTFELENTGTQNGTVLLTMTCPFGTYQVTQLVPGNDSYAWIWIKIDNINGFLSTTQQYVNCTVTVNSTSIGIWYAEAYIPFLVSEYGVDSYNPGYGNLWAPAFNATIVVPYASYNGFTWWDTYPSWVGTGPVICPLGYFNFSGTPQSFTHSLVTFVSFNYIAIVYSTSYSGTWQDECFSTGGLNPNSVVPVETIIESLSASPIGTVYLVEPFVPFNNLRSIIASNALFPAISLYYSQYLYGGVNMTTVYVSPNGLTIIPLGNLLAVYTNSTDWFLTPADIYMLEYTGGNPSSNIGPVMTPELAPNYPWINTTAIAFPVAPNSSNKFYLYAFVQANQYLGSYVPLPLLLLFNVTNIGHTTSNSFLVSTTYVNNTSGTLQTVENSLPSGTSAYASISDYGNYSTATITVSTPFINITSTAYAFASYMYVPTMYGEPGTTNYWGVYADTGFFVAFGSANPTSWFGFGSEPGSQQFGLIYMAINNTKVSAKGIYKVVGLNGTAPSVAVLPMFNMTETTNTSTPQWTFGLSLAYMNTTISNTEYLITLVPYYYGVQLYIPQTPGLEYGTNNYYFMYYPLSNVFYGSMGYRKITRSHSMSYFLNVTLSKAMGYLSSQAGYLVMSYYNPAYLPSDFMWAWLNNATFVIAYPMGYVNASKYTVYIANGTVKFDGYTLVPVINPGRSINETVVAYKTILWLYVNGIYIAVDNYVTAPLVSISQTPQVIVVGSNGGAVPATVSVSNYVPSLSPLPSVTTSSTYTYMGFYTPLPYTVQIGSTNQVYTTVSAYDPVANVTYTVTYQNPSTSQDPSASFTIPSGDDPVITIVVPVTTSSSQPPSGVVPPNAPPNTPACQMINALSISPYNITAYVNQSFTITVTLSLNSIPQQPIDYYVNVSIINSTTLVSNTTLPIYAWGTETVFSNSTTLTAPPYPGSYVIIASICGKNATDPLTVVGKTTAPPPTTNQTKSTPSPSPTTNSTSSSGPSSSGSSPTSGQSTCACEPCTAMLHCWLFWLLLILLLIIIGWWIYKKKTEVVIKL